MVLEQASAVARRLSKILHSASLANAKLDQGAQDREKRYRRSERKLRHLSPSWVDRKNSLSDLVALKVEA